VGVRLAQISEFSILIAYIAFESQLLGPRGLNLIQGVTIITFVVSTYWVVLRFPTPVAMSDRLRMD
jgi:predicted Kef-type K+ transport protein